VDDSHRASAEAIRGRIECGDHDPSAFRATLLRVPPRERDAWLDVVFGTGAVPDDGPELPQGCVPYLPCPVDALLRLVDEAGVTAADVFVDVGAGVGRAGLFVHLLTGAEVIAIEIQSALVAAARDLAKRLRTSRVSCVEGDAVEVTGRAARGTVFFLYCPFSGARLAHVLGDLEAIARTHAIRVACVDLPLPACAWLSLEPQRSGDLTIHRSGLPGAPARGAMRAE
jgi:hypothetical protein